MREPLVIIPLIDLQDIIKQTVQQAVAKEMADHRTATQPPANPYHNEPTMRYLRISDIIGDRKRGITPLIPISKAAWYTGIKTGRYPQPVKLTEKTAVWRSTDIEAMLLNAPTA